MEKIVIIGAGIAGVTAAENIRKNNKDIEIVIISNENYLPYSRIKLSKYISCDINYDDLLIHKNQWYKDLNIKIILSSEVTKVLPGEKAVILCSGDRIEYTKLIFASGSRPFMPPFKGLNKTGIFSVRKLEDIINITKYIEDHEAKNIVIIGGGVLGIEAAWSIKEKNSNLIVGIIENASRMLSRQVDEEGSEVIKKMFDDNNINLYLGETVQDICNGCDDTNDEVSYISLGNGNRVAADVVIISAGIRSNINIAKECNINVNSGIIVDKNMETNLKDIYAAGDVAEYEGHIWGLWAVATEQGRIAGLNAIGISTEYVETAPVSLLKVMGVSIFSAGEVNNKDIFSIKYENGIYTKAFLKDGKLKGVVLIGDTKKGFSLKKAIDGERDFSKELDQGVNLLHIL